jgi:oxaloacetate decarboxylase gamma subunit
VSESSLINEGLNLMLVGMGFVFVFLTLLVIVTGLMSRIISKYEKNVGSLPAEGIPSPTAVISPAMHEQQQANDQRGLITVISAAIHKYRSRDK